MPFPKGDTANLSKSSIRMVGLEVLGVTPQSRFAWAYWSVPSSQHISFSLVPRGGLQVAPTPPWAPMGLLLVPQGWAGGDVAFYTPSSAGASACRSGDGLLPA